jgi:hypothetical protein
VIRSIIYKKANVKGGGNNIKEQMLTNETPPLTLIPSGYEEEGIKTELGELRDILIKAFAMV